MTDTTPAANESVTIRRTIRTSRERVFAAWTEPAHLKNWWRMQAEFDSPVAEVDLRVGGKFRLGMQEPGQEAPYISHGEFREIDPPARLVYTWNWEADPFDSGKTLVTVEFLEQGDATEVVLTHSGFPAAAAAAEHDKGWNGVLNQLATLLEN